jgi:hypothetical protein
MEVLYLFNTIVFGILGIMWSKNGFLNLLVKIILIVGALLNLLYTLKDFGYLIKI